MQKGFGFAALIIAFVAIFVPVFGPWITIVAASLAAFSYGQGLSFGIATIIINLVNIIFLSPSVWVEQAIIGTGGHSLFIPYVLLGTQGLAAVILIAIHQRFKNVTVKPTH